MTLSPLIAKAEKLDAKQIADLVNLAYRGESSKQGWTTEADLLDGCRTDLEEVLRLITTENSIFLLCKIENELVGSVHLQKQVDQVCLSMLAVSPTFQSRGIGKQLLEAAELMAQDWATRKMVMEVISCRNELIAFYLRRGYRHTGESKVFPVNPSMWLPKAVDLHLDVFEKML
jgi:ribosomal protein S18 acetylase RimI-like enzyme